jgi:hypothetical protein
MDAAGAGSALGVVAPTVDAAVGASPAASAVTSGTRVGEQ